jgi:hypothetical protein
MKLQSTLTLAVIIATLQISIGQTEMLWDSYGLGFTLEKGMSIITNNGDEFTAESKDLYLSIHPMTDANVTEDHLIEAVIAMAEEMEYDDISDADVLELADLYGVYIEGKTNGTSSFLIALMDTESAQNYIVIVLFSERSRDAAIRMVHSFFPYD